MEKVTVWKLIKKGEAHHNHIEHDWVRGDYPKPIKPEFKNQEAWKSEEWKKEYGYLDKTEGRIVP